MAQKRKRREAPRGKGKPTRPRTRAGGDASNDEMVRRASKSPWQERSELPAGEPLSREELAGMDLLGRASVRDDAIPGVSEASAESGIDRPSPGSGGEGGREGRKRPAPKGKRARRPARGRRTRDALE